MKRDASAFLDDFYREILVVCKYELEFVKFGELSKKFNSLDALIKRQLITRLIKTRLDKSISSRIFGFVSYYSFEIGEHELAKVFSQKSIEINRNEFMLWVISFYILDQLESPFKIDSLLHAIKLKKSDPILWALYAKHFKSEGSFDKAIKGLRNAIKFGTKDIRVYENLVDSLIDRNKLMRKCQLEELNQGVIIYEALVFSDKKCAIEMLNLCSEIINMDEANHFAIKIKGILLLFLRKNINEA